MVAKLMKTLELHYPTLQFLITWNIPLVTCHLYFFGIPADLPKKLMCIPRKCKRLVRDFLEYHSNVLHNNIVKGP